MKSYSFSFFLLPPKRLSTVVKNILGGGIMVSPMSNRVKATVLFESRQFEQVTICINIVKVH